MPSAPHHDDRGLRDRLSSPVAEAAVALLGCELHSVRPGAPTRLRITEVEAYGGEDDAASHARRGLTARNRSMFAGVGTAYVYLIYGMHLCLNVVTGDEGEASAVLVRAAADPARPGAAVGPGRLTRRLGLTREDDGMDLLDPRSPLHLLDGDTPDPQNVLSGPRVGVTGAADRPWRFWIATSPEVSRYRRATPRASASR